MYYVYLNNIDAPAVFISASPLLVNAWLRQHHHGNFRVSFNGIDKGVFNASVML